MSLDEKKLKLKQCIEAGYGFVDGVNPVKNLITGLENNPKWFDFLVDKADYNLLAILYADVLTNYVSYSVNDTVFEILHGISVTECIKTYIVDTYFEDLPVSEDDINVTLEDSVRQMTQRFDTSEFRTVESSNIEDFMENAAFGSKSYINDTYFYKVRNQVDNDPYTIYFDENGEMKIL